MTMSELASAQELLEVDKSKKPYKLEDWVFVVLGVGMVVFQMLSTITQFQGTLGQQNVHLMLAMVIVLMAVFRKKRQFRWVYLGLIVIALIPTLYVQFFQNQLEFTTEMGRAGTVEIIMGILLVIMPILACYFAFGAPLAIVALVFLAYLFLGQYLPITFGHGGYTLERMIIQLSIGLSSGVYGSFLQASLSYIFLLIVFGSVLQITGASGFFMELAKMVGQRIRGGVAQTAVISSAMVGTISGSPMANVAITGAYTIPTMKSVGFEPKVAGGVEAAASTGGQIMPPVMGAAAFIMASLLGVPYAKIMLIGFIPAFLYFTGVFAYIFFHAGKWKVGKWHVYINKKEMLLRSPLFIIPLGLLMYFLMAGYTVMFGAFWAIVSAFVLAMFRKETRPSLRDTIDGLADGAQSGCGIAVTCSVLGMMTVTMTMTGLGLKIPDILQLASGGLLVPALVLAFIAAIILGCGLHTVAVYTIVALTVAPALVKMGVPLISAHYFILYGGVFSNVTPPVAMAALVGAGIAGSKYIPTAWEAFKIALPGFILPFTFIWCPPILGNFTNPLMDTLAILSVAAALFAVSSGLTGYFIYKINWLVRCMVFVAAAGFLGFSFSYNFLYLLVALALVAILAIWQVTQMKKTKLAQQV